MRTYLKEIIHHLKDSNNNFVLNIDQDSNLKNHKSIKLYTA